MMKRNEAFMQLISISYLAVMIIQVTRSLSPTVVIVLSKQFSSIRSQNYFN